MVRIAIVVDKLTNCLPPDTYRRVRTMPGCTDLEDDQIRTLARHFYFTQMAAQKVGQLPVAVVEQKKKAS